jgi:hypothetical protein
MTLYQRINLLTQLGEYFSQNPLDWQSVKQNASINNAWFTSEFIDLAVNNIQTEFLQKEKLVEWAKKYDLKENEIKKSTVGLVMAGNIPLVGFHDFLCVFINGFKLLIKPSGKDEILIKHIVKKLAEWNNEIESLISFAEILKNCDAYIATGSNNSSRYFEYYFSKHSNIIRRNRTSVAVLEGNETNEELEKLAADIQLYFGLGCRNITKLYVPENYNFIPLLNVLKKYDCFIDEHKYRNNFDYQLALLIMNNKKYMNSGAVILTENAELFSPVSQMNYECYRNKKDLINSLRENNNVQCIVSREEVNFGSAQIPSLTDYADGIDTMNFLKTLL